MKDTGTLSLEGLGAFQSACPNSRFPKPLLDFGLVGTGVVVDLLPVRRREYGIDFRQIPGIA